MDVPSTAQAQTQSQPQTQTQPQSQVPLSYRVQLLQKTANRVPFTAEGLPTGFYRTDLLPTKPSPSQEELQALEAAYTDLSFEHGYPTLPDGRPFWQKLDFEPGFAFGAFQIYLEQLDLGPRELTQLADNQELHALSSRMAGLEEGKLIPKEQLRRQIVEFSVLYYWRARSKAHDLYKEAAYRHLRLRRQMSMEDRHYTYATNLMEELKSKVLDTKDFWDNMSGKTAVDLLSKLVAIQRVSVGLPAAGPLSQKESPEDSTFEMIIRTLGQKAAAGAVYENQGGQQQGRGILQGVLEDPTAAKNLQEVIIRVSQSMHKQLPNPHGDGGSGRQFKGRGRTNENIGTDELSIGLDMTDAPGANLDNDATIIDVEIIPDSPIIPESVPLTSTPDEVPPAALTTTPKKAK